MLTPQLIEEIRNKNDIVALISEYLPLKKRGKNYLGLCPFHPEKDASFTVSPEKQIFHCFGCNEGGNVFAFLMKIDNLSFMEAVEELAAKANIPLPQSQQINRAKNYSEKYHKLMQIVAAFFQEQLQTGPAKAYLEKRNINDKTIKDFMLGYAPAQWDGAFKYLVSKGYNPDEIEKCGLIIKKENKNDYYDRFRDRLVFPIIDQKGKIIAFGGRALGNEEPKYLNSPETVLYQKAKTLFGLNLSKDSIKKQGSAILVEGYFDMITPYSAGFTNICASLGTALTIDHAKLLFRFCQTVIIAFDADSAGSIATQRSVDILRGQGLDVKIAKLMGGKDPDEIINNQGKEGFAEIMGTALSYLEYKIAGICQLSKIDDIESRAKAIKSLAQLLAKEKDTFVQKEYAKLAANTLKIGIDTLLLEIQSLLQYNTHTQSALSKTTQKPLSKLLEAEKTLLALSAQDSEMYKRVKIKIGAQDFTYAPAKEIFELMDAIEVENASHFLLENLPNEESRQFLSKLLVDSPMPTKEHAILMINDCLKVLEENKHQQRIQALKLELKQAEEQGPPAKIAEILNLLKSEIS